MAKRKDIKKILIIGSGPIIIGQACEFDYSGAQACKALRAEGYDVILVNSNPATIMTDPELARRTYIEPLTREYLEEIIAKEKPHALLPTVGGQQEPSADWYPALAPATSRPPRSLDDGTAPRQRPGARLCPRPSIVAPTPLRRKY